jgi:hypothetical protein
MAEDSEGAVTSRMEHRDSREAGSPPGEIKIRD